MKIIFTITCLLLTLVSRAQPKDLYNQVKAMGLKGKPKSLVSFKYTGTTAPGFEDPGENDNFHRMTYMFSPDGRVTFKVSSTIRNGKTENEFSMIEYREDGTAEANIYSADTVLVRKQEYKPLSDTSYELSEYDATNGVMIYKHRFFFDKKGRLKTEEAIHYQSRHPFVRITDMIYDKSGTLSRKNTLMKKRDNSPGTGRLDIMYNVEIRDDHDNVARLVENHSNGQEPFTVINVYTYYE